MDERTLKNKRDARLRRAILRTLNEARPMAIRGRILADVLESLPDGRDLEERELLALCQDLVSLTFATVRDTRELKAQRTGLEYMEYAITADGTALLAGGLPVNPLIEDERRA